MNPDEAWLQSQVIEFIAVLDRCLTETTYVEDRGVFTRDIATAARWLIALQHGTATESVAEDIMSKQTDKTFCDYWRQGSWGDLAADALKQLRETLSSRFPKSAED